MKVYTYAISKRGGYKPTVFDVISTVTGCLTPYSWVKEAAAKGYVKKECLLKPDRIPGILLLPEFTDKYRDKSYERSLLVKVPISYVKYMGDDVILLRQFNPFENNETKDRGTKGYIGEVNEGNITQYEEQSAQSEPAVWVDFNTES